MILDLTHLKQRANEWSDIYAFGGGCQTLGVTHAK